eukprot:365123-Chlamydomonas_euryale.AAC.34
MPCATTPKGVRNVAPIVMSVLPRDIVEAIPHRHITGLLQDALRARHRQWRLCGQLLGQACGFSKKLVTAAREDLRALPQHTPDMRPAQQGPGPGPAPCPCAQPLTRPLHPVPVQFNIKTYAYPSTCVTSPSCRARWLSIVRAVSASSAAGPKPMIFGSRWRVPRSATMPTSTSRTQNVAAALHTRMSHAEIRSTPPPTQHPTHTSAKTWQHVKRLRCAAVQMAW